MKKLSSIILFLVCAMAVASAYTPMLRPGNMWTYLYAWRQFDGEVETSSYQTYEYRVLDPVVIDGVEYFRLKYDNVNPYEAEDVSYLLREDLAQERVYIRREGEAGEYLLYDFSLESGDSADVFCFDRATYYEYGNAVDSTTYSRIFIQNVDYVTDLQGNRVKRLTYFKKTGGVYDKGVYLERYGALEGDLIGYNSFVDWVRGDYSLICGFDELGNVVYHYRTLDNDSTGERCYSDDQDKQIFVTGSLNPAFSVIAQMGNVVIRSFIIDETAASTKVSIFTVEGRQVYDGIIPGSQSEFSVSLAPGAYLVCLETGGKTMAEKVLVR